MDEAVRVIRLLTEKNMTLATAESCTGGLLGKLLTDVPGASAAYLGGVISYAYAVKEKLLGVKNPRVGLINNGAEDTKGTPMHVEAYQLLKQADQEGLIRFVGNVEGRDIALGAADVLVTDGFTGNVVLKTYEGLGLYLVGILKGMFKKNILTMLAALLVKGGLNDLKQTMDYKKVGGAPLLGISRPVIKAHGSSDPEATRSAVAQACRYVQSGIIEEITDKAPVLAAFRPAKKEETAGE